MRMTSEFQRKSGKKSSPPLGFGTAMDLGCSVESKGGASNRFEHVVVLGWLCKVASSVFVGAFIS